MGWYAAVRVDGEYFRIWGGDTFSSNTSTQTSVEFTPTRTSIISSAGQVEVNVTIWNPIEVSKIPPQKS
jgi:hypothetical protein